MPQLPAPQNALPHPDIIESFKLVEIGRWSVGTDVGRPVRVVIEVVQLPTHGYVLLEDGVDARDYPRSLQEHAHSAARWNRSVKPVAVGRKQFERQTGHSA